MNFDAVVKFVTELFNKLVEFVKSLIVKYQKPADKPPVTVPTDPKPEPVDVQPEPTPTKPADPIPVVVPAPTKPPEAPPLVFTYGDGVTFTGSGHPLRNTFPAGEHKFYFTLPAEMPYQVDVYEVPGTVDGTSVIKAGEVTTEPMTIRYGVAYAHGTTGANAFTVTTDKDNSFGVVVYF